MSVFRHIRTVASSLTGYMSGISALALPSPLGDLFSANGVQGGILVFDPDRTLLVSGSYQFAAPAPEVRIGLAHLEQVRLGGKDMLLSFGQASDALAFDLTTGGLAGPPINLSFKGQTLLAVTTMALADGSDLIFTSALQGLGVTCWLRSAAGRISLFQRLLPNNASDGYDVQAIELLERSDGAWLLSVSAQDNALNVFRIAANGLAQFVSTLGAAEGLGINAPNLLQCAQIGGKDYAVLGAAGSGSIVVVAVGATGKLTLVDQVNDYLNTRFDGLSVLETISVAGRFFVLAGGGDDGLSLMTLLPNGRLLHLATVADTLGTALNNVSATVLTASGSGTGLGLDIFATGFLENRISQFRVDLGALAPIQIAAGADSMLTGDTRSDLLVGGAGDDHLYGGAGGDILIDGAGRDTLHGGGGADIFVFSADGQRDAVLDFDTTLDRLDLSGLGRIYSRDAISFSALAGGILLSVQGEQISIFSADGRAIPASALTDALLFNMSHVPIYVPITTGRNILGTRFSDTLLGSSYNDTLVGGKGNDLLFGGAGYDRVLFTEMGPVVVNLSLTVAQDTGEGLDKLHNIEFVTSGDRDDILTGSPLHNSLISGAGNDRLYGGLGNDTLTGGLGNDVMDGGGGVDLASFKGTTSVVVNLAQAGAQNTGMGWDTLRGIENLIGGNGNDRLSGTAGANNLWGDAGNDTLYGGLGDDAIYGGSGADRVIYSGALTVVVNLSLTGVQNTGQGRDILRDIEHVTAGSGNDRLIGNALTNSLVAGAGSDSLYGGLGNDLLYGGAGNDMLSGGREMDFAVFRGDTVVTVNLALIGRQNTGVGWDILIGIENLVGSSGNDRLSGSAGANRLYGEFGNDTLLGGLGNDVLNGGSGIDQVIYTGGAAVTVNLAVTGAQNTGQGRDILRDIENTISGSGSDHLSGNARANSLKGGAGNDWLYGRDGTDKLYGEVGQDHLYGGLGNDSLYGGAGNDVLDGGGGNQVIYGGAGADTFVFRAADHGKNQVFDLGAGDHIRLLGYGYASDRIALNHFKQTSQGVVFTDHLDTVLFLGTHLADFTAEMILL